MNLIEVYLLCLRKVCTKKGSCTNNILLWISTVLYYAKYFQSFHFSSSYGGSEERFLAICNLIFVNFQHG